MMGTVYRVCRNVKQWRNAARALRWTAADAEGRRFSVVLSPQALARAQSNADRSSRQVRDPKQLEENLNVAYLHQPETLVPPSSISCGHPGMISREFLQKRDREGYGPIVHRLGSPKQKSAIVRPIKFPEPCLCTGPVRGVRLVNRFADVLEFRCDPPRHRFLDADRSECAVPPYLRKWPKNRRALAGIARRQRTRLHRIFLSLAACVIVS